MIIDMHYHMIPQLSPRAARAVAEWPWWHAHKMGLDISVDQVAEEVEKDYADPTGEKLIERMDRAEIDVTVFCAVDNADLRGNTVEMAHALNQKVSTISKSFPDRCIALAGVDPRRPEAPELLKRCLDTWGMRGLKLHPDHGYYPNSPEVYRLLEIAQQAEALVLIHTGPAAPPGKGGKYAHPLLLDDLTVDFPTLTVIAAHMGQHWWRAWAGLAYYQPNLFGDLAEWQILAKRNFTRFCRELREIIDLSGVEKILFGSDGPIFEPVAPVKEWVATLKSLPQRAPEGITFTQEEIDAILGGNARRILKI